MGKPDFALNFKVIFIGNEPTIMVRLLQGKAIFLIRCSTSTEEGFFLIEETFLPLVLLQGYKLNIAYVMKMSKKNTLFMHHSS